ncbi:hypothetical protein D3C73_1580680 [compost metagenome]
MNIVEISLDIPGLECCLSAPAVIAVNPIHYYYNFVFDGTGRCIVRDVEREAVYLNDSAGLAYSGDHQSDIYRDCRLPDYSSSCHGTVV